MNDLLHKIGSILLILFVIPVVLVLTIIFLPIAIIGGIIDIPFKKKRIEKLRTSVTEEWIPNKKYIYLSYNTGTKLAKYIATQIIPVYEKYMVVDIWDPAERKGRQNWPNAKTSMRTIQANVIRDCDGEVGVAIVGVLKKTNYLDKSSIFRVYKGGIMSKYVPVFYINGEKVKKEDAETKILEEIQNRLKEWGVKL